MKKLYCGNYPELQERFVAEISTEREENPLAPLDVIVRGQLQRLALRRDLARAGCSHANIRFRTLHELAEHEAMPQLRRQGLRLLRDVHRGPLMLRAIELAAPLSYYGVLAGREGFRNALWRTLDELRGAGMDGKTLARVADRRSESVVVRKLHDLARILAALEKLLTDHRFVDPLRLMELACETEDTGEVPLVLYGLDELSALELRFVARLAKSRSTRVFLPYRAQDEFEWVKPLYEALLALGFAPEHLAPLEKGAQIVLVSAPSRDRETEEITRELLFPRDDGTDVRRIGVLLRNSEAYVPLLRCDFQRAGITGYFHQCRTLRETPAGRAFDSFCALLDGRFARADVTEFLLSAPAKWPSSMADGRTARPPVALWNQFALIAGITSGAEAWRDALQRLERRLIYEREAARDEEGNTPSEEHVAAAADFRRYIDLLVEGVLTISRTTTWQERIAAVWALFSELVEPSPESATIQSEFDCGSDLDLLGVPLAHEHLRSLVRIVLFAPVEREGRFQVHEPTVATFAEAQGLLFDEVLIPGMVEKEVPRPVAPDPLLLDDERALLEEWLGGRVSVPLRKQRRKRERFAFYCALTTARGRVVLLFHRRESGGRERLPSSFLLDVLSHLTRQTVDYEALERFIRSSPQARRVPANRLIPTHNQLPNPFARNLQLLARALSERSAAPIIELVDSHPFFQRAAQAEEGRFRTGEFTRFDGLIEENSLRARLAERLTHQMSPTRMEDYAACPFRHFATHVLELENVNEPEELVRISHLERGRLIHEILEQFLREEHSAGHLPLQRGAEERLVRVARRTFDQFERTNVTGPALLWQVERKRMLRMLTNWFEREINEPSRFVPRHFEHEFEFEFDAGTKITFHGKMDRVDVSADGGRARVIDYKSGSKQPWIKDGSLCGGRALQLAVYRLAVERDLKLTGEAASYLFLSARDKGQRVAYTLDDWQRGREQFVRTATTILNGVAEGRFFPYPDDEQCRYCPVRVACGSGRMTFKWRGRPETGEAFRAMRESER